MTTLSLGHAARLSRPGKTAITGVIKVAQLSRGSGGLIARAQLRDRLEPRFGTSGPQEFVGGFVDFLLGRGTRDPR